MQEVREKVKPGGWCIFPGMNPQVIMLVLALLIGAGVGLQALVNARLNHYAENFWWAAVISFAVGTAGLLLLTIAQGQPLPARAALAQAPWWAWTGGLLGAAYIATIIVLVPRMSPAMLFGAIIFGQMLALVVAEHFGAMGVTRHPMTIGRAAGVALIVVGAGLCKG